MMDPFRLSSPELEHRPRVLQVTLVNPQSLLLFQVLPLFSALQPSHPLQP
jgi:hypothetical protein